MATTDLLESRQVDIVNENDHIHADRRAKVTLPPTHDFAVDEILRLVGRRLGRERNHHWQILGLIEHPLQCLLDVNRLSGTRRAHEQNWLLVCHKRLSDKNKTQTHTCDHDNQSLNIATAFDQPPARTSSAWCRQWAR